MRVRWTRDADNELLKLVAYIQPRNPSAARWLYKRVRARVRQLEQFPRSGHVGVMADTRELYIQNTPYLAICIIDETTVWIMHILHTAQKWPPEDE